MDTSIEYVKMCKAAEEIQSLHEKYDQTDSLITNLYSGLREIDGSWAAGQSIVGPNGQDLKYGVLDVWLPRQDQLQHMVNEDHIKNKYDLKNENYRWYLIGSFYKFTCKNAKHTCQLSVTYTSLEQLWLMYVMYINFGKYWNAKQEAWQQYVTYEDVDKYSLK